MRTPPTRLTYWSPRPSNVRTDLAQSKQRIWRRSNALVVCFEDPTGGGRVSGCSDVYDCGRLVEGWCKNDIDDIENIRIRLYGYWELGLVGTVDHKTRWPQSCYLMVIGERRLGRCQRLGWGVRCDALLKDIVRLGKIEWSRGRWRRHRHVGNGGQSKWALWALI